MGKYQGWKERQREDRNFNILVFVFILAFIVFAFIMGRACRDGKPDRVKGKVLCSVKVPPQHEDIYFGI